MRCASTHAGSGCLSGRVRPWCFAACPLARESPSQNPGTPTRPHIDPALCSRPLRSRRPPHPPPKDVTLHHSPPPPLFRNDTPPLRAKIKHPSASPFSPPPHIPSRKILFLNQIRTNQILIAPLPSTYTPLFPDLNSSRTGIVNILHLIPVVIYTNIMASEDCRAVKNIQFTRISKVVERSFSCKKFCIFKASYLQKPSGSKMQKNRRLFGKGQQMCGNLTDEFVLINCTSF